MTTKGEYHRRLWDVSERDVSKLYDHFIRPAEQFDPDQMGEHLLFPREMTWFYGEPVYRALPHDKQLMLNRLCFCQSYLSTAVAEAATNVLNYEACLDAFLRDQPDLGLYMANEVIEESTHIKAFLLLIRKVVASYGLSLSELHAANVSLPKARSFQRAHSFLGWLRGDLNFYYFTRYALNINQKTVERCTINEPDMHPAVREILKNHAIDEARHMQMSRETGKLALLRMGSRAARDLAGIAYAHFAARIYIGRHRPDGRLQRLCRIRTLELCGVPRPQAERAYVEWRDRVHQPEDPPLARAGRLYYLRQNLSFIDELDVSPRVRAYMKRTIERTYSDVAAEAVAARTAALEFRELERPS